VVCVITLTLSRRVRNSHSATEAHPAQAGKSDVARPEQNEEFEILDL